MERSMLGDGVGGVLRVPEGKPSEPVVAGPSPAPRVKVPLLIVVGADKGGVGKTTVARAVCDYLTVHRRIPSAVQRVWDTEAPAGDLQRFWPAADIVDVATVTGQMRVFDRVSGVVVIDIRAGLMSETLRTVVDAGLLDDVRRGTVNMALLHVLGPTIASYMEVDAAAKMLGHGAKHFIVKNYINETEYAGWGADPRFAAIFQHMSGTTVQVPHLAAAAVEVVQERGVGFCTYSNDAEQSAVLRGRVRRGDMVDAAL
jgi:hypothetical protein